MHQNKGKSVAKCLSDRTEYAMNDEKTEDGMYVSSYACNKEIADKEFMETRREYLQKTGRNYKGDIIAYQIRQSFKPGEINAEDANKIGYETAMRFTKGKHAFIVATHTDRKHIHNHIIFNSINLEANKKFRDSWFCGLGLRRLSDLICMEHGLSVIRPFSGSKSKPKYEKSYREEIREEIDKVLDQKPSDFQTFLKLLMEDEYEIKKGKYLAIRSKERKNFIRFKSLGSGYTEDDLLNLFLNSDQKKKERPRRQPRKFDMLVDIQEKLQQGKGKGYAKWGKQFNNKAIMKTLLYLDERGIRSYNELEEKTNIAVAQFNQLTDVIKSSEKRLKEISELRTHIINYSKTRNVYIAYRQSGYSKKFYEENREAITLHKAAKEAFKELNGPVPKVKDLSLEFNQQLKKKRDAYKFYKDSKLEMRELLEAKRNIDLFQKLEEPNKNERERKREKNLY